MYMHTTATCIVIVCERYNYHSSYLLSPRWEIKEWCSILGHCGGDDGHGDDGHGDGDHGDGDHDDDQTHGETAHDDDAHDGDVHDGDQSDAHAHCELCWPHGSAVQLHHSDHGELPINKKIENHLVWHNTTF